MDFPTRASEDTPDPDAIIVKADEVDEAGADISAISPSNTSSESDFNARIENRRAADAQATGSPKILANAIPSPTRPISRPILRREGSAPAPPTQPPPPAPPRADAEKPTDSLSLQQLKKLVGELPKLEPAAYAYQYAETRSFAEELQEWFVYNEEERLMLLRAREDFEEKWTEMLAAGVSSNEEEISWIDAQEHDREAFLEEALRLLKEEEIGERVKGLESLSYICLGTWGETVGLDRLDDTNGEDTLAQAEDENRQLGSSPCHIEWIKKGVHFLIGCRALGLVKSILRNLWESEQSVSLFLLLRSFDYMFSFLTSQRVDKVANQQICRRSPLQSSSSCSNSRRTTPLPSCMLSSRSVGVLEHMIPLAMSGGPWVSIRSIVGALLM